MTRPLRRFAMVMAMLIPAVSWGQERVAISIEPPASVAPGKSFDLVLLLDITTGYHIQASNAKKPYVPTTITVQAPEDFEVGKPVFPEAKTVKLFGEELTVYEAKIKVKIPVTVPKGAKGKQTFSATINYQACDESTCDPPKDARVETEITIQQPKPAVKKPPAKKPAKKKGKRG